MTCYETRTRQYTCVPVSVSDVQDIEPNVCVDDHVLAELKRLEGTNI